MKPNLHAHRYGYTLIWSPRRNPCYYWIEDKTNTVLRGSYAWTEEAAIKILENRIDIKDKFNYNYHNKLEKLTE